MNMASQHTVTVLIAKDGKTNISVDGVKGKSCLDITKVLEESLGTVAERTDTADMGKKPDIADRTKVGH
jgi:hypothetical protein